jgi:cytochrome c-type biogenesis protein CcmH/NrfG
MPGTTIRTEIRGLDLTLDEISLSISQSGQDLIAPAPLSPAEVDRLRLEMAKALLPEWNQLEEMKARATARNRRYLGSWVTMCVAAFSAYVSYPSYYLCVFLSLLSIFLWWRAGFMEQKEEREAQAIRDAFRPDWTYLQERLQESDHTNSLP